MTDKTSEPRLVQFADAQATVPPEAQGQSGSARQAGERHTASDSTAPSSGREQPRGMTITDIEKIAIAARAAWHSAEQVHQETRDENRAFYADFEKMVADHADKLTQLEARFEQSEQKMNDLVLEASRLIAEHQESVAQFNNTTRRLALSGFVMILILLVVMEIFWWVG